MAKNKTISGHEAITSWGSPLLRAARIPGLKISLRTRRAYLPLFLALAVDLNKIIPLSVKDTWSFNYRKPRMNSGVSDHAGYAIDCWSAREGAHTWPSRMKKAQAEKIAAILEGYKTPDGRHIFLWGASKLAPGVDAYSGPTHQTKAGNDPMHFAIARGITVKDAQAARRALKIRYNGTRG